MTRKVLSAERFDRDVGEQIAWLTVQRRESWIEALTDDVRQLATMLAAFPAAGQLIERSGREELCRIHLRQTPFRAIYSIDVGNEAAPITLLRLFHVRQRAEMRRALTR